jgi:PilZ domain
MRPLGDRRIRVRFEVVGRLSGTLELSEPARAVNISAKGVLIRTLWPVPVGSLQTIHLNMEGGTARVSARVCRLARMDPRNGASAYAVGLEFVSPPAMLTESVAQLIDAQTD